MIRWPFEAYARGRTCLHIDYKPCCVQTHLENPTDYHIRQSRRQQVKEYLSTTFATKQTIHAVAGLLMSGNSAPNSPMAMLNISSSHETEMDEVIDDIISMQSNYDDIQAYIDPVQMPNTVSTTNPLQTIAMTSNSCPANLTVKREIFDSHTEPCPVIYVAKERQKKDNHNLIERRRRFNINDRIKETYLCNGLCILYCVHSDMRWNKGTILRASVEYIKRMQKDAHRSREVENNFKRMEMANKQLMLRIQELEMQARIHGLPSPSPSALNPPDPMGSYIKQETSPEENLSHSMAQAHHHPQHLPQNLAHPQSLDLCDGIPNFSDGMSGLGDLGGLDVHGRRGELGFLMMDEPLSPMGGDPLLSAMSPEASVDSSRRSSFSIEDGDIL
uniref:Transcription factor EB n=1 Tax=Gasterosteus aculeatus aculeatus TaxID=481459 RepID=G3N598_GASAC